eukprot:s755_g31.t2
MQGCGGGGLECAQHQTAQVACACFRRRMLRLFCFCLTLVVSRAMHTRDASSITDIDVPGAPGGESSSSALWVRVFLSVDSECQQPLQIGLNIGRSGGHSDDVVARTGKTIRPPPESEGAASSSSGSQVMSPTFWPPVLNQACWQALDVLYGRTRRELPPSHRHLGHLCSTRCLALINRGRRQRMLSVRTATATTLWRPSGSSCSCRRPSRQWSLGSKQAKQGSPTNVPSGPRGPQR